MEPKNSKIFSRETMQVVSAFCESKQIKDIDNFIYLCFKQGFDIKKYGLLGETLNEGEKHLKTGEIGEKRVEIEVIKEIRVEVPVEVIKEVPVEVIKEVEKIIYTSDDTQVNELLSKIEKLNEEISIKTTEIGRIRGEFSNKTEEMENIFQNKMSKKDEELDEFRQKLDILVTNDKTNMLQETLQNLRGELQQKNEQIKELNKINRELLNGNQNQAYLLKGSNLRDRL
jgi:predicted RNase H-like nuclease (RuvC/YqgF family)